MKKLDFLSDSPKAFIFQKSSNKTTFGGFLAIIYILVILIIAFTFIYNYAVNDKYIISYINFEKPILPEEAIESKLDKDPNYNPTLNFSFDLVDSYNNPLSDNFLLVDTENKDILERGENYQFNVSSLNILVIYKCFDMNCSLRPEDKEIYEDPFNNFCLSIRHSVFTLDFQNKEKPVTLSNNISTTQIFIINPDIFSLVFDEWQIIKIKEEKGMLDNFFGNKNDSFGGTFYKIDSRNTKTFMLNSNAKTIFEYKTINRFDNYAEYSRKKVSVFTLIANICSLALTIFNGFRFGFNFFYSEKFSNYKVIDNILTSKRKPKTEKIIENKFDKSFPLLSINEMKDVEIEEKEEEEETEKINQTIEKEEDVDSLPKYHIFSFIGNFFYCKCCKKNKIQANITMCNNIIEKYYSIENLIYNQFMLENLLQDYKWNNPDLNSIKNIELIYKLKQMIKTDGIIQ